MAGIKLNFLEQFVTVIGVIDFEAWKIPQGMELLSEQIDNGNEVRYSV